MRSDEWNKADVLDLKLLSPINPFDRGEEGLEEVLDLVESAGEELRPGTITFAPKEERPYSRRLLRERLAKFQFAQGKHTHTSFTLGCAHVAEAFFHIVGYKGDENSRFRLHLHIKPFSWCHESGNYEERVTQLIHLVHTVASRMPLSYGYIHSNTDSLLDKDLDNPDRSFPTQVERMYWLNVYGPRLVEQLGRERVLSTPAWRVEELPYGAVLLLTRPTPVDFASDEARLAQARALVHLNPGASLDSTLTQLHQRSLAFTPLDERFHPDVKEILQKEVEFQGLVLRRPLVERFNHYQPPPVSECLPAIHQPWPDVPDTPAAIDLYEGLYAERLLALLHKKVPSVMDCSPESLPDLDWYAYRVRWTPGALSDEQRTLLVSSLGGYLGMLLVRHLQGRWVPRRDLDEAAVVVGDKAWRPFLRARHGLEDRQAALDFSLTQLFREAQRSRPALTSS